MSLPEAGYFRTRLVKGGRIVAMRIWFDHPTDPESGDRLDRSPRWWVQVNGGEIMELFESGITAAYTMEEAIAHRIGANYSAEERSDRTNSNVWSNREPITRAEYDYYVSLVRWDTKNRRGPRPTQKVDWANIDIDTVFKFGEEK